MARKSDLTEMGRYLTRALSQRSGPPRSSCGRSALSQSVPVRLRANFGFVNRNLLKGAPPISTPCATTPSQLPSPRRTAARPLRVLARHRQSSTRHLQMMTRTLRRGRFRPSARFGPLFGALWRGEGRFSRRADPRAVPTLPPPCPRHPLGPRSDFRARQRYSPAFTRFSLILSSILLVPVRRYGPPGRARGGQRMSLGD